MYFYLLFKNFLIYGKLFLKDYNNMSYSYVKTVFPDFEFSNVYNDKLYTNDNQVNQVKTNITGFENNLGNVNAHIETYKQIEPYQEPYKEQYKSNLKYYNKPVLDQDIPNYTNVNPQESFQITPTTTNNHDEYINHINSCPSCKDALLKQLGIETERLKNEAIMELTSYVLFGIFIIILLDSLKK